MSAGLPVLPCAQFAIEYSKRSGIAGGIVAAITSTVSPAPYPMEVLIEPAAANGLTVRPPSAWNGCGCPASRSRREFSRTWWWSNRRRPSGGDGHSNEPFFKGRLNMGEGLFQPMHLLVIAIVALLVFGPKKLPELGKGLGEGIRSFKKALSEVQSEPAAETKEQKVG